MQLRLSLTVCAALTSACSTSFSLPDEGPTESDAGTQDAGLGVDAGPSRSDAGPWELDAASPQFDAGPRQLDAAAMEVEAGCHHGWFELAYDDDGILDATMVYRDSRYYVTWRTLTAGHSWLRVFDQAGAPLGAAREVPWSRVMGDFYGLFRVGADGIQELDRDGAPVGALHTPACGFEAETVHAGVLWGACADGRLAHVRRRQGWDFEVFDVPARFPLAFSEDVVLIPEPTVEGEPAAVRAVVLSEPDAEPSPIVLSGEVLAATASPEGRGCAHFLVGARVEGSESFEPHIDSVCGFELRRGPYLNSPALTSTRGGFRGSIALADGEDDFAAVYADVDLPSIPRLVQVGLDNEVYVAESSGASTMGVHPQLVNVNTGRYAMLSGNGAGPYPLEQMLMLRCDLHRP